MRWNIIGECIGEDGKQSTITLGIVERLAESTTAENLGVNLQESKQIANRLQDTVVNQQLQEHCEQRRKCLTCGRLRPIKDFRCRTLDTVLGTVRLRVPRYRYCKCGCDTQVCNPTSEVLSGRVTPEQKCSRSSGTRMVMPNSTFRRSYGKADGISRPSCVLSPMVRTA
jgi:hypothetical protein